MNRTGRCADYNYDPILDRRYRFIEHERILGANRDSGCWHGPKVVAGVADVSAVKRRAKKCQGRYGRAAPVVTSRCHLRSVEGEPDGGTARLCKA